MGIFQADNRCISLRPLCPLWLFRIQRKPKTQKRELDFFGCDIHFLSAAIDFNLLTLELVWYLGFAFWNFTLDAAMVKVAAYDAA